MGLGIPSPPSLHWRARSIGEGFSSGYGGDEAVSNNFL